MSASEPRRRSETLSEQLDAVSGPGYSDKFLQSHLAGLLGELDEQARGDDAKEGRAAVSQIGYLKAHGLPELRRVNALHCELIRLKTSRATPSVSAGTARSLPSNTAFPTVAVLDEPTPAPAAVAPTAPKPLTIDERVQIAKRPENVRARELARLRKAREGCLGLSTKSLDEQIRKLEETP